MKYLLMVCPDASIEVSSEEVDFAAWGAELDRRGVAVIGSRLRPRAASTVVSVREGELTLTDGPFAEGKEYFAGFDAIDCSDLDEAIEVASKHPMAKFGTVEIRPFWPFGAD